jgi:hypothetical protein
MMIVIDWGFRGNYVLVMINGMLCNTIVYCRKLIPRETFVTFGRKSKEKRDSDLNSCSTRE